MSVITKLTKGKSWEKRVNVFLDGKFTFSLPAEVAKKERLQVEQELSSDQVKALSEANRYHRCLNAAIRYLGYRPRSEAEVRQRLQQKGFDIDCTEKTIAELKEQELIDDITFARLWKENREAFSPRSRWLNKLELRRKGLNDNIIEQVISEVNDSDSAYRAALSKARHLSSSDYQLFRHRLSDYLKRRGFGYEVINETVQKVWKEHGNNPE
jgi:regulatory protein